MRMSALSLRSVGNKSADVKNQKTSDLLAKLSVQNKDVEKSLAAARDFVDRQVGIMMTDCCQSLAVQLTRRKWFASRRSVPKLLIRLHQAARLCVYAHHHWFKGRKRSSLAPPKRPQ